MTVFKVFFFMNIDLVNVLVAQFWLLGGWAHPRMLWMLKWIPGFGIVRRRKGGGNESSDASFS